MDWTRLTDRMHRPLIRTLGEPVIFVAGSGGSDILVRGIYERPPIDPNGDGGVDMRVDEHRVTVRAIDLPVWATRGTRLDVRGISLTLVAQSPDGQGLVSLECRRG